MIFYRDACSAVFLQLVNPWLKSTSSRFHAFFPLLQQQYYRSQYKNPDFHENRTNTRLPKSSKTRENVGRGGRRKNGRTAWQMIFGYLASRGTGAPPHLNLGSGIAQYVKASGVESACLKISIAFSNLIFLLLATTCVWVWMVYAPCTL